MSIEPTAIIDNYIEPLDNSVHYPKIAIDDIEVCALHYNNCQEVIDAWNRRKVRVNYNNIFVIGNSWNCHQNEDLVKKIANCKYQSVVFTYGNFHLENGIVLTGKPWHLDQRSIIRPNIINPMPGTSIQYFEKYFDFVNWLNCKE